MSKAAENPQLGAYQLAVDAGAFDGLPDGTTSGGAQLVFLGTGATAATRVAGSRSAPRSTDPAGRGRWSTRWPTRWPRPRSRRPRTTCATGARSGARARSAARAGRWSHDEPRLAPRRSPPLGRASRRRPPEQRRVIEAPLAPSLVVAGAGSGKTETMAARVVWLLANGLVEPDQVLGLTFTRKAAGELAERVRKRLRTLARAAAAEGVVLGGTVDAARADALAGLARPTISTYNSYAASLVADHALRLGLDPSARLLGEAAQWQLASEVVEAWSDDLDTDAATSTVIEAVLDPVGRARRAPARRRRGARPGIEDILDGARSRRPRARRRASRTPRSRSCCGRWASGSACSTSSPSTATASAPRDAIDFGDQVALAARLALDVPGGRRRRAHAVPGGAARRVPGHLLRPADPARRAVRRRAPGDRGRRPAPVDLRLARRERGRPRGLPDAVPAGPRGRHPRRRPTCTSCRRRGATTRRILAAANHVAGAAARVEPPGSTVPVLAARPGAGDGRVHAHVAATVEDEARAVAQFVARAVAARRSRVGTGSPPRCCAASAPSSSRCGARCGTRGLPVEVVGLGGLLSAPEVVDLVAAAAGRARPVARRRAHAAAHRARTALGAADLHALAAWAGELAARHDGGRRGRDAARGQRTGDAAPRRRPGRRPPCVVEADAVDERSIVDALDAIARAPGGGLDQPRRADAQRDRPGTARSTSPRLLRVVRSHTYLSVPELVARGRAAARARHRGRRARAARRRAGRGRSSTRSATSPSSSRAPPTTRTSAGSSPGSRRPTAEEHGLDMPVAEPDPTPSS